MATLAGWIDNIIEDGEKIEAVVFGEFGWGGYGLADEDERPRPPKGKILTHDEAKPFLDVEFYSGYGSPSTYAINVWTDKRVMFVTQYDGSTSMDWVYRNPTAYTPTMPGG